MRENTCSSSWRTDRDAASGGYLIKRLKEVYLEEYEVVALGTNEVAIAPPSGQADYRKTQGVF